MLVDVENEYKYIKFKCTHIDIWVYICFFSYICSFGKKNAKRMKDFKTSAKQAAYSSNKVYPLPHI